MEKPIVIFGASGAGQKIADVMDKLGKTISFFVDNNSEKWNGEFFGKPIKAPDELLNGDYSIVIGSTHVEEIEKQLENMGLKSNLKYGTEYKMDYINEKLNNLNNLQSFIYRGENKRVLIDISTGEPMCGIWSWSFNLAKILFDRNVDVKLLCTSFNDDIPHYIKKNTSIIELEEKTFTESVMEMTEVIIRQLPCTIIINFQGDLLYAAIAAKKLYPNEVNIISVVHNDEHDVSVKNKIAEPYLDKIICVSLNIKNKMNKRYGIPGDKLFYKESPLDINEYYKRVILSDNTKPIIIGYAARLEKYQKRADLLIQFINIMEQSECKYQLFIAGTGTYYSVIEQFLIENSINNVKLFGRIERTKMKDFWKECNVFINLSEFEGSSLSMLEAMANGVVPIVTRVSGTNEFIIDGENGYIDEIGDIEGISNHVVYLEKNRYRVENMADKCINMIRIKCNPKDYYDCFKKLL